MLMLWCFNDFHSMPFITLDENPDVFLKGGKWFRAAVAFDLHHRVCSIAVRDIRIHAVRTLYGLQRNTLINNTSHIVFTITAA